MIQIKYIEVAGLTTRYIEAGQGEPMLFVHGGHFGIPNSANDWWPVIDRLAKDFRVLAIDKPGQGYTDNPEREEEYVIGTTVSHAYGFLNALGIQESHLIGHSRGGYTVCRLALENPEAVYTVTLVDSGTLIIKQVEGGAAGKNQWYQDVEDRVRGIKDPMERYREKMAANSFGRAHISDEWIKAMIDMDSLSERQEAAKTMTRLHSQFVDDLSIKVDETHQWIKDGKLKCPTLVIWAYNDPSAKLVPGGLELMDFILPNVPRSQMHILNQAGHFCYREQPDAFTTVVKGFIESSR